MNAPRTDDAASEIRDVGFQAERAALSWSRTALAILVNALVALRTGWANREVPITALAFALLIAAAAVMCYGACAGST